LEFTEKASACTSGGGTAQTDLAVDDDWGIDVGSTECIADGIEIGLKWSG
jgi:hypothetical protein